MIYALFMTGLAALPSSGYQLLTLSNPDATVTDFSLLVDLSEMSASWWAEVDTSDGTKGRAAIHSSSTELACDWIDFDDTGKTGLLRVLYDGDIKSSGTFQIRVYPPQATTSSYSASDTYGSDNAYDAYWVGYWPDGGITDRTTNSTDGTFFGDPQAISGPIGGATEYDGSGDYMTFTVGSFGGTDPVSAIAWMRCSGNVVAIGSRPNFEFALRRDSSKYSYVLNSLGTKDRAEGGTFPNATWTQAAGVFTGSNIAAYGNGTSVNSGATSGTYASNTLLGLAYFGGTISPAVDLAEVSFHSTNRSDAWIAYEYDQVADNASFYTASVWRSSVPVFLNHYMRRR